MHTLELLYTLLLIESLSVLILLREEFELSTERLSVEFSLVALLALLLLLIEELLLKKFMTGYWNLIMEPNNGAK